MVASGAKFQEITRLKVFNEKILAETIGPYSSEEGLRHLI